MALVTVEMVKAAFQKVKDDSSAAVAAGMSADDAIVLANQLLGEELMPLFNMSDSGGTGAGVTGVTVPGDDPIAASITLPTLSLSFKPSGVTAGVYGGTQIPSFTVDTYGRITDVTLVDLPSMDPTGPAGGDLSGTYPNPSVSGLRGFAIPSLGVTAGGLRWNGSSWVLDTSNYATVSSVSSQISALNAVYVALDGHNSPMTGSLESPNFVGNNPQGGNGAGLITRGAVAWWDPSRPTGERYWDIYHDSVSGKLKVRAVSDTGSPTSTAMEFSRSGSTATAVTVTVPLAASSFIKSGGFSSQFLKADGSVDSTAYATSSSLGNYVLKIGDGMTGGLSIGLGGTTPYPLGSAVPLSVSSSTHSNIITKSTSATASAAVAFITASNSGSSWTIGKGDTGLSGSPVGSLVIWDATTARFWLTSSGASFRVPLETIGTLTANGGISLPSITAVAFPTWSILEGASGLALQKSGTSRVFFTASQLQTSLDVIPLNASQSLGMVGALWDAHLGNAWIGSGTGLLKVTAGAVSVASVSDLPGGPYLPLSAGSGNALTGELYASAGLRVPNTQILRIGATARVEQDMSGGTPQQIGLRGFGIPWSFGRGNAAWVSPYAVSASFTEGIDCRGSSFIQSPTLDNSTQTNVVSIDIVGSMKLHRIVVSTATYTLPTVPAEETIQIIFNVLSCDVSTGTQSVSFRGDDGVLRSEVAGGYTISTYTSFGRIGTKNRSMLLTGVSSTIASIIN